MRDDASARTDEALLELLLTFSIPQRDVQPLAKELLRRFGSLAAVLEASPEALCAVGGIKASSTVLLRLVDAIRKARAGNSESPPVVQDAPKPIQQTLFDSAASSKALSFRQSKNLTQRMGTGLFGKSAIKDAVALLPHMPVTDSAEEVSSYLSASLPYNSAQTRERFKQYFRSQMFPNGLVDTDLIRFAHAFPHGQDLKDVCLYRFCVSLPLVVDFAEYLIQLKGPTRTFSRDFVSGYLEKQYPGSRSVDDCTLAIVSGFTAAGVFRRKGKEFSFVLREVSIPAFAFILHNEFSEPGMYDIGLLEKSRRMRALLWKPDRILPALYELRNLGLVSKVSEIDSVRQFTTRLSLAQVVERLVSGVKQP